MKRVIIESPYAGEIEGEIDRNVLYAREAMRHSLMRGEAPFASHLLYTQEGVLNDALPAERLHGIAAGFIWHKVADFSAFYTDLGWSNGMLAALWAWFNRETDIDIRLRSLKGEVRLPISLEEKFMTLLKTKIEAS